MLYDLSNTYDLDKFNAKVDELLSKRPVVDIVVKKPQRSLAQNSYLHLLLGFYASEFGYTLEEVKQDIFKKVCNSDIFIGTRINRRGQQVKYVKSTRELDTREMTLAIDRFRNWSSAVSNFYLPAPDEFHFLVYAQKQIDENASYL